MSIDTINKYRIDASVELARESCCVCGVQFAYPVILQARCRANHTLIHYCPHGHGQHYTGPTEAERLRNQLERAYSEQVETRRMLAAERKSHAATKGVLTKARKRAQAGVCLYCHRTFANYARHMTTRHAHTARPGGEEASA